MALMAVQTLNRKMIGDSQSCRSQRHQPPFVLGKVTIQVWVFVSLFLTMHVIKYFSVQGGKCSTYYKLHVCLAEEMQFRDMNPFHNWLMDICILPG